MGSLARRSRNIVSIIIVIIIIIIIIIIVVTIIIISCSTFGELTDYTEKWLDQSCLICQQNVLRRYHWEKTADQVSRTTHSIR